MDAEARSVTPTSLIKGTENGVDPTGNNKAGRKGSQSSDVVSSAGIGLHRQGSLSMTAKAEVDDDEVFTGEPGRVTGERTRRSRFPRKVPVIDANNAQASVAVGPFDRTLRPPSPMHPETRVVWVGDLTPEVLEYLTFCRYLLGRGDVPVSDPLEEDEQALEFLQEHGGNDVERARLMLISSMGGGSEYQSVLLDMNQESKTRPRTKGAFKTSVGGDFPDECANHPEANNASKLRVLWRDWTSRCKKAMANSQSTASDLFALQKEEHQLPRFQSRNSDDDTIVSAANDASFDLEVKLKDIKKFVAAVHDALSLVQPARRLTASALKKLADEAPKKIQMKEVELVRDLVAKSESWEKRARRWLAEEPDEDSPPTTTTTTTVMNGGTRRGGGIPNKTSSSATGIGEKEFTLAELSELIREGSESQVDHSATLMALARKREECENLMKRAASHVPQEKMWKQNRKKYEILPLPKLKAFREEMRKAKIKLVQIAWADNHLETAQEWLEGVHRATTEERHTIRELTSLLNKADQIPVDLSEEKKILESFVKKAEEWVKRAKEFFPPTRSSGIVIQTKKTRATLAATGETGATAGTETTSVVNASNNPSGFQKGSAKDFLALRDEAIESGVSNVAEAVVALEAAENIEEWISRVQDALRQDDSAQKLKVLNDLLSAAEQLPVVVEEERALRQAAMMMEWSKRAEELVSSSPGTVSLAEMQAHMAEADRQFPDDSGGNKRKKTKRTRILDHEIELRASVDEANKWIEQAAAILEPSHGGERFESPEQLKEFLAKSTHADISDTRNGVIQRVREIGAWQRRCRIALIRTGQFDPLDIEQGPTYDVAILGSAEKMDSKTQAADEGGEEDEGRRNESEDDEGQKKIPLEDLREMLAESQRQGVKLPEQSFLATLDAEAKDWLARFAIVSLDGTLLGASQGRSSKSNRRRGRGAGMDDIVLPSPERLELSEEDVEELMEDAEKLAIGLDGYVAEVDACLRATREWRETCAQAVANYRAACEAEEATPGVPDEDPALKANNMLQGGTERETRGANKRLLNTLKLIALDERGQERFPSEVERDCLWWKDEPPARIRLAVEDMVQTMREAEEKRLHLSALDSEPVRTCTKLIQAELWLQQVRRELFASTEGKAVKSIGVLCEQVLAGTRLVFGEEGLPSTFPHSELDEYAPASASTAKEDEFGPSTTTTQATIVPTPSKRPRLANQLDSKIHTGEGANAAANETSPSGFSPDQEEWRILRYVKSVSPAEAEAVSNLSMAHPTLFGLVLRRLFGLRRVIQNALASRALARRMNQIPRAERTQVRLRQLLAQSASWTSSFALEEETRFRQALNASEAWANEKKRTMVARTSTVDQLIKLAERGERVWVDMAQVEQVRKQAETARAWLNDYLSSGLDQGTSSVEDLKSLLLRGEKIQGVDLARELDVLRRATEVFCMCRGARDDKMMRCTFCNEEFHVDCLGENAFANACPLCIAVRAADFTSGLGRAAICRLQALDSELALFPDHASRIVDLPRAQELCEWFRLFAASVLSNSNDSVVAPPPSIRECHDVVLALDGWAASKWRQEIETIRHRPTLENFEKCLQGAPRCIPREMLRGLHNINIRAQYIKHEFEELWSCPLSTPAGNIIERCRQLKTALENVPIDFGQISRALDACAEDKAQRYCTCQKFNDGKLMVECERCRRWFHAACVGLPENTDTSSDFTFSCPECKTDEAI